ncbi:MAG: glycosyltransferase [Acidobacteriota bacterium]
MSTYLFASQPARGHINPMLAIGRQMQSRGHHVVFAGFAPGPMQQYVETAGFQFINIRSLPIALVSMKLVLVPLLSGFRETWFAAHAFYSGLTLYGRAFQGIIERVKPDAVVCDFAYVGAGLAAETRRLPYALVYHAGLSFRGPGIPPFASGLPIGEPLGEEGERYSRALDSLEQWVDRTIHRARQRLGLPPSDSQFLTRPQSPWLTLVLSAEASEAPRDPLPPTSYYVGPCFTGRGAEAGPPFDTGKLRADSMRVYVSMGTVFNRKPHIFQKIISAFSDGSCQLVVSAGCAYSRLRRRRPPSHVLLYRSVPQIDVLKHVDAVISHGGNNTVNETLAAGRPLLVLPVGGEQGDNASRVVALGVGLRAHLTRSTSEEIAAKVSRLLSEADFKMRAQEVAAALARMDGPSTAARFLERLVETRQPLIRPAGYPQTVTRDTPLP